MLSVASADQITVADLEYKVVQNAGMGVEILVLLSYYMLEKYSRRYINANKS